MPIYISVVIFRKLTHHLRKRNIVRISQKLIVLVVVWNEYIVGRITKFFRDHHSMIDMPTFPVIHLNNISNFESRNIIRFHKIVWMHREMFVHIVCSSPGIRRWKKEKSHMPNGWLCTFPKRKYSCLFFSSCLKSLWDKIGTIEFSSKISKFRISRKNPFLCILYCFFSIVSERICISIPQKPSSHDAHSKEDDNFLRKTKSFFHISYSTKKWEKSKYFLSLSIWVYVLIFPINFLHVRYISYQNQIITCLFFSFIRKYMYSQLSQESFWE